MRTEDLLTFLKDDMGELLHVYVPEKYLASDSTGKVFMSTEQNWYMRPPAIIRVDGAIQVTGYSVNYSDGRVTFALAQTGVVTAEFAFSPFSDGQLSNFLKMAQRELSSTLGEAIADGSDLNLLYEAPVLDIAYRRAFRSLMAVTANYSRWRIDGAEYDKQGVTLNYQRVLTERSQRITEQINRLRLVNLSGGESVDTTGFGTL